MSIIDHKSQQPSRWAMEIRGPDEHGKQRALALGWDGRWHRLNPDTGAVILKAGRFGHMQLGRTSDGRLLRRVGGHSLLNGDNRCRWVQIVEGKHVEDGQVVYIDVDEDLEVADDDWLTKTAKRNQCTEEKPE